MSAGWVLLLGLFFAGVFSALHLALIDLARGTLEDIAASRNRPGAAERIAKILDDQYGHARAVGLLRSLAAATVAVSAVAWVAEIRGEGVGTRPGLTDAMIGVSIGALLMWLVGVAVSMSVAYFVGERMIYAWSPVVRVLHVVFRPFLAFGEFIDEVVRRLAGVKAETEAAEIEQELLSVIEEGEEEGHFDATEADMIEAIVRFRDLTVEQVMTPRTEIEAMEVTDDLGSVVRKLKEIGHSRIPVYEESLDNVLGIFYVKDLMHWLAGGAGGGSGGGGGGGRNGQPFSLRTLLRPAIFVPETKTVRELLQELMQKKVHIAMVADEYGGTAGLVTIEDIVEEIVGEIQDEYDKPEEEAPRVEIKLDERAAEVDARAYINDVNDRIEPLGWKVPEADEYDTVAGFVVTTLGRIPQSGEQFRHGRTQVTVLEASPTRVLRVRFDVAEAGTEAVPAAAAERDMGDETDRGK